MACWRMLAAGTVALSCSLTGCLAVYTKRPVEVIVTNADTGQPVTNLPVSVDYVAMLCLNIPKGASGITDENGRVVLTIADFERGSIGLRAGDFGSTIEPKAVREGGTTTTAERSLGPPTTPRVILQLIPQHRSFAHRLFGGRE